MGALDYQENPTKVKFIYQTRVYLQLFVSHLLQLLALRLVKNNTYKFYGLLVRDRNRGDIVVVVDHIKPRWVLTSIQENNIISRSMTGNLMLFPAKIELIYPEVAYHLGYLSLQFALGSLDKESVYNADETYFVFDLHNHKTLAMREIMMSNVPKLLRETKV